MEPFHIMALLGLGFVIGLKHAFEADHIVAVSAIVSQTRSLRKSSIVGLMWGLGHTTTLFLFGLLILVFKVSIPKQAALYFEFLVGFVLVILGISVLRNVLQKPHIHSHHYGKQIHSHAHSHKTTGSHTHAHRSFAIGLIHGLAGSAALMLLVLATVDSIANGLLYIAFFGIGSVFGMLFMGIVIGLPFLLTASFDRINRIVKLIAGTTSIFLGILIMYQIAV